MKLIEHATAEKLRGGFYTPAPIASFVLKWGINGNTDFDILEPSCGDGVFLEELKDSGLQYSSITAVEFDEVEAEKAEKIELANKHIINADFHLYCNETNNRFDLIVGNPPYIRFQYFDTAQQAEAEKIFKKSSLKYSKLTNAWVSFIVGSSQLLKEKGRIGFVIPAEILQVSYAQQLREFLAHFYNKITIISFEKLVFPDIQQEVVLLLCEKNLEQAHLIDHIELKDASDLINLDISLLRKPSKKIDFKANKWTFYFLDQQEIDFLENVASKYGIPSIGDYADVEVGITTGSNDFFTVPLSTVEEYSLHEFVRPMVGRSVQVNSVIFDNQDWQQNREAEAKAHLLVFPNRRELVNHKGAKRYIADGEEKGINKGYKCGIRDDWFVVPSIKLSEALFIRRNNLYPKLIQNEAAAYTTDTMHRVFLRLGTSLESMVASFYNSLSFAFAEISGRSYGGGVLELMPSETEKILLPYKSVNIDLLSKIDDMMRRKESIDEILLFTNKKILQDGYGLTDQEVELANSIWRKLSSRRMNRSK